MLTRLFNALKIVTLAIVLSFGLSFVYAWTAPTATPPGGNVSAPINTSVTEQTKLGAFNIGSITAPKPFIVVGTIGATGDICTSITGSEVCLSAAGSGGSFGTNLKIAPSYTDLYNQNTVHSSEQTFSCSKGDINPPTDGSVKYVFVYMKGGNGSNGTGTGGEGGVGGVGGKKGVASGAYGGQGADGTLGKGGNGYIEYAGATVNTAGGGGYDADYSGGTAYSAYDVAQGGQGGGGVAIHTSLLKNYEPILAAGGGASGAQCGSGAGGGGYGGGGAGACWSAASGGGAWIGGATIRIKSGAPYSSTFAFNPYDYGNGPFKVIAGCGGLKWGITSYTSPTYDTEGYLLTGGGAPIYGLTTTRWDGHGIAKVWW